MFWELVRQRWAVKAATESDLHAVSLIYDYIIKSKTPGPRFATRDPPSTALYLHNQLKYIHEHSKYLTNTQRQFKT